MLRIPVIFRLILIFLPPGGLMAYFSPYPWWATLILVVFTFLISFALWLVLSSAGKDGKHAVPAAKALRGGANDLCGSGSINAIDSVLKLAGQATPDVRDSALFSDVVDCARSAGFTPARRGPTWDIIEVYPQAS